jgi:hypothetical protein
MRHRTLAVVVTVLVLVGGTLSAQGQSANPILQAIQTLQETVSNLVTAVNHIDTTVAAGNVLSTPAVLVSELDFAACTATNVSAEPRTIKWQVLNADTGAVMVASTVLTQPNRVTQGSGLGLAEPTNTFCKFTVLDGVKSDVRASVGVYPKQGEAKVLLTLAAQ